MTAEVKGLSRHDVALMTIALVLLAGLGVGQFSPVRLPGSLFVSSIPATACVGYVLFYRPPTETH